jgi:hypothetical protein
MKLFRISVAPDEHGPSGGEIGSTTQFAYFEYFV